MLELLIAVAFVCATVAWISILLPKASANIANNRHRMLASNFAATRIQELKAMQYYLIPLTPADDYFTGISGWNTTGAAGCDCSLLNWDTLLTKQAPDAIFTEDGVTYTRQICINYVNPLAGGGWTPYCPIEPRSSPPDCGLKAIRVRVSWVYGSGAVQSYETESMVTR